MRRFTRRAAKPALAAAVVVSLVTLMTGCEAASSSNEAGTTITVWDPNYEQNETTTASSDAVDAAFTEQTGINVERVAQPYPNYDQLLQAAFTGKEGPDVMLMLPGATGVLRYAEGLEDLDAELGDLRDQINFWETTSPTFETSGPAYGVPIGSAGIVFYYNKELFAQAGLDPEAPPSTFDELLAAVDALESAGITPIGSGNKEGYENQWYLSATWAALNSRDDSKALALNEVEMTDERFVRAFEQYQRLHDAGAFADDRFSLPLFTEGIPIFEDGKSAMFLGLTDTVASWQQFNEKLGEENVGYFHMPSDDGYPSQLAVGPSYVWSVPTFTEHRDAALEWVRFTGSAEAQEIQFDVAQAFPNNTTVELEDAPWQLTALIADYTDQPTFLSAHQLLPGEVLTEYTTQANEVLQGRLSLTEMLTALETTFEGAVE